MSIAQEHIPYYQDVFGLANFVGSKILTFGYQDCTYTSPRRFFETKQKIKNSFFAKWRGYPLSAYRYRTQIDIPIKFKADNLQQILINYGAKEVKTLDLFDERSDYKLDMNYPISDKMYNQFDTIVDVGCLEHVFDTKQCLSNLFKMIKVGGSLMLHTPCNGYFNHGFHVFSPECIAKALTENGFEISYLKYSTDVGVEIDHPRCAISVLLWIAARKVREVKEFVIPQQAVYSDGYMENYNRELVLGKAK